MNNFEDEMEKILDNLKYWNDFFPNDVVTIGGVAVYLHALDKYLDNQGQNIYDEDGDLLLEGTHDGDFYITQDCIADFISLEPETTTNRRLRKHELKKDFISYDIYKQYENSLCVADEDLKNDSEVVQGIRVASLEHLLSLKLKAAMDITRMNSKKGEKDIRDIIKIIFLKPAITKKNNLEQSEIDFIKESVNNNNAYIDIANGNDFYANKIKTRTKLNFKEIESGFKKINKSSKKI